MCDEGDSLLLSFQETFRAELERWKEEVHSQLVEIENQHLREREERLECERREAENQRQREQERKRKAEEEKEREVHQAQMRQRNEEEAKLKKLELEKQQSAPRSGPPSRPPPLSPRSADKVVVKAIFKFEAEEEDELNFRPGEEFVVLQKEDDKWWWGEKADGTVGLFPHNFVLVMSGDPKRLKVREPEEEEEEENDYSEEDSFHGSQQVQEVPLVPVASVRPIPTVAPTSTTQSAKTTPPASIPATNPKPANKQPPAPPPSTAKPSHMNQRPAPVAPATRALSGSMNTNSLNSKPHPQPNPGPVTRPATTHGHTKPAPQLEKPILQTPQPRQVRAPPPGRPSSTDNHPLGKPPFTNTVGTSIGTGLHSPHRVGGGAPAGAFKGGATIALRHTSPSPSNDMKRSGTVINRAPPPRPTVPRNGMAGVPVDPLSSRPPPRIGTTPPPRPTTKPKFAPAVSAPIIHRPSSPTQQNMTKPQLSQSQPAHHQGAPIRRAPPPHRPAVPSSALKPTAQGELKKQQWHEKRQSIMLLRESAKTSSLLTQFEEMSRQYTSGQ